MAKRISRRSQNQQAIHTWWASAALALVFLGLTYGFASWAIDSGSLWLYALTLIFFVWAINRGLAAVRYALDR